MNEGVGARRRAVLLATVAMAAVSAPARAQPAPVVLPEITVEGARGRTTESYLEGATTSATKTDSPVVETPQSVSTVTRRQMDDQNAQTGRDALAYTPGVLTGIETTSRYDSLFMRGFGSFGTSTNVVDFLDGLRLPRGQAFALPSVDPFLLDSLDVLRGPAAVLYGQTTPGGLVNQISRAPSARAAHEVRLEAGSHDRLQAGLASQGALDAEGVWQYSFSGIGRRADTQYDKVEEQRIAVAPAIAWQPSAETRLTLQGFYQHDPEGGYFNSLYARSLAAPGIGRHLNRKLNVGDPSFDRYDRTQYAIGYTLEHRVSDAVSVTSKLRYSAIDLDFQSLQMAGPVSASGLLPRQALRSLEQVDGIAADNAAQFRFTTGAVAHRALLGFDLQRSVSSWEYRYGAASSLDVTAPRYGLPVGALTRIIDNRQTLQQLGVYVQDQMSLGGFRLLLGARHDWTEQESENRLAGTRSDQSSRSPSYRAGLLYRFDNGIAPYVSYATSFEPVIGTDAAGNAFRPTEGRQWEAGVKYEPSFISALFTASVFEIRQENVLTPGAIPGFQVQQGEVRSRGLELEARGKATRNLELIASLTLLDTEVTRSTTAANIGKRPQAAPDHYGSVWASYAIDAGALDGLTLGAGVRVVGGSYGDDANTVRAGGYTLVDLAARYDLGKLAPAMTGAQATLNVTNLFDKDYYASCSSTYYCQWGNGARVLGGLRYRW
ncbi:TonB-dependent siderophore receptor [Teichococcus cervicalis]|uniref:TonB-dependent siderophore receptor n=1 Tax=Pseudoroseomonas cervicalis ATCC 49957 TaxID=525371 RepID=D5RTD0_9PROT|nr:TonB-dependent siderophore receptor [Pseudoroseomonas cervicalis]EFH09440.1 TonB-dependent siderophore receptor [Pseudoroseomonas cervicalis ATCC 49957]